ncbi:hypothetical protein HDU96_006563 [Phlyctochytrium bullatum]|nr:hypothetical protein HDU96_006563 [Phlyctochytrium bullatum]
MPTGQEPQGEPSSATNNNYTTAHHPHPHHHHHPHLPPPPPPPTYTSVMKHGGGGPAGEGASSSSSSVSSASSSWSAHGAQHDHAPSSAATLQPPPHTGYGWGDRQQQPAPPHGRSSSPSAVPSGPPHEAPGRSPMLPPPFQNANGQQHRQQQQQATPLPPFSSLPQGSQGPPPHHPQHGHHQSWPAPPSAINGNSGGTEHRRPSSFHPPAYPSQPPPALPPLSSSLGNYTRHPGSDPTRSPPRGFAPYPDRPSLPTGGWLISPLPPPGMVGSSNSSDGGYPSKSASGSPPAVPMPPTLKTEGAGPMHWHPSHPSDQPPSDRYAPPNSHQGPPPHSAYPSQPYPPSSSQSGPSSAPYDYKPYHGVPPGPPHHHGPYPGHGPDPARYGPATAPAALPPASSPFFPAGGPSGAPDRSRSDEDPQRTAPGGPPPSNHASYPPHGGGYPGPAQHGPAHYPPPSQGYPQQDRRAYPAPPNPHPSQPGYPQQQQPAPHRAGSPYPGAAAPPPHADGPRDISFRVPSGIRLAAKVWGTPPPDGLGEEARAAACVLAVHGWLDNANSWDLVAPRLVEMGCYVVCVDLPGHGHSEHRHPQGGYYLWDMTQEGVPVVNVFENPQIDDLLGAADHLRWPRFTLLGHSTGGHISATFAGVFPTRVRALVMIESIGTSIQFTADEPTEMAGFVHRRREFNKGPRRTRLYANFEEAANARTNGFTKVSIEAARRLCERGLEGADGRLRWRTDPRLTLWAFLHCPETTVQAMFRAIAAPVLILAGGASEIFSLESRRWAGRLAAFACLRKATLQGNHHLHLERESVGGVVEVVADFLGFEEGRRAWEAEGVRLGPEMGGRVVSLAEAKGEAAAVPAPPAGGNNSLAAAALCSMATSEGANGGEKGGEDTTPSHAPAATGDTDPVKAETTAVAAPESSSRGASPAPPHPKPESALETLSTIADQVARSSGSPSAYGSPAMDSSQLRWSASASASASPAVAPGRTASGQSAARGGKRDAEGAAGEEDGERVDKRRRMDDGGEGVEAPENAASSPVPPSAAGDAGPASPAVDPRAPGSAGSPASATPQPAPAASTSPRTRAQPLPHSNGSHHPQRPPHHHHLHHALPRASAGAAVQQQLPTSRQTSGKRALLVGLDVGAAQSAAAAVAAIGGVRSRKRPVAVAAAGEGGVVEKPKVQAGPKK